MAREHWDEFQHLCSSHLHHSVLNDADDPMVLFTSILKDTAEEAIPKTSAVSINHGFLIFVKMQSKSAIRPSIDSNVN